MCDHVHVIVFFETGIRDAVFKCIFQSQTAVAKSAVKYLNCLAQFDFAPFHRAGFHTAFMVIVNNSANPVVVINANTA